jgi:signal transduction histidine kinase
MDHESTSDPDRQIRFQVLREGFDSLSTNKVVADFNLLLQAINNILDNAGKYSFRDSCVVVSGGLTGSNRFHITVLSRGIPISADEIRSAKARGWRSKRAKAVTGEGSGIGLWIVNHIVIAHDGELLISPTNAEGYTEVKLILPAEVVKMGKKEEQ